MEELMLKIDNVVKEYKLGEIGGTTLRDTLQRFSAKLHNKPDPTKRIGAKDYNKGEKFMALNGVSFEVKKGERVGIIGHNGAGKSTLLKLISRVTAPTQGTISLNGRVASMLEVGTGFHGELTGRENVYMNGAILGMTKKEIDAKMEDIIEFSEVRQFIDTPVKRYSSGMYVKLAFSVAAHLDSEIMIMDEVLAVGDMTFQKKCIDKMNQVSKDEGRTILYVSHNMNTIRELCDRVVVLDHGKVVFNGGVEEGISIYFNKGESGFPVEIDLDDAIRPWYFHGSVIRIKSFSFLNKKEAVFVNSEKINFRIDFYSKEDVNNLKLYLILCSSNGDKIGMAQTYNDFGNVKKDTSYSKCFEMDCSNLAAGQYKFKLDIFTSGKNGEYKSYDHPMEDIYFELLNVNYNGIKWGRNSGYVMLNDIKTIG